MYISGHESILDETLESIGEIYFDWNFNNDTVNYYKLKKGMIYPDLPCGKYELISKGNDVYSIMNKKSVCNITKLHKIMGELDNLREIFQSHRGIYAFLHSMSYNPTLTAGEIRQTIMSHVSAYALLSIYDKKYYELGDSKTINPSPSIFWIGIILHIITDSYSQSHTVRLEKTTTKILTEKKKLDPYVKFRMVLWETIFKQANESRKHFIDNANDLQIALLKKFPESSIQHQYIMRKKHRLFKAYKMFLFDVQTKNVMNKFVKNTWQTNTSPKYDQYDIINFQYYNNQSSTYHKKRDFIYRIKKYPVLYDRMIDECKNVLLMYKECLENIKKEPTKHQQLARRFIRKLCVYLSTHTFRMTKQNLNNKTWVIYKKNDKAQ